MRGGGFVIGAVGGLVLALLVVGAATLLPQASTPFEAASTPACASQSPCSAIPQTASSTTTSQSIPANNTPGQVSAGAGLAVSSSSTTSVVTSSSALATSSGQAHQRPSSMLAVLPGESVGSLMSTISPLLVGLLAAVLVYSAYARRQDASS